jgi:hypothetical protein
MAAEAKGANATMVANKRDMTARKVTTASECALTLMSAT